jgi:hypothetical protein
MRSILQNIKARFVAKPYNPYSKEIIKKSVYDYWICDGNIYYGDRWGFFIYSDFNHHV